MCMILGQRAGKITKSGRFVFFRIRFPKPKPDVKNFVFGPARETGYRKQEGAGSYCQSVVRFIALQVPLRPINTSCNFDHDKIHTRL